MLRRFSILAALVLLAAPGVKAATLTVQTVKASGITPTFAAASVSGDACANDGRTFLRIKNSSGSNAYTVTVVTPRTVDGIAVADVAVTVGTNAERYVGPFPVETFNDGSRLVSWTYTGTAPATDLTVGCFSVPYLQ